MNQRSTGHWAVAISLVVLLGMAIVPAFALASGSPVPASHAPGAGAAASPPTPRGVVRTHSLAPISSGGGSTSGGTSSDCVQGNVVDAYCGHYYEGAQILDPAPIAQCNLFCEDPPLSNSLSMTVTMPTGAPAAGDNWAVILSAFDDAGLPSYDQVGFAPYAGVGWVPVYSYSTACGEASGIESYLAPFVVLAPNTQYTFTLHSYPNGTIGFLASLTSTGAQVFSDFQYTGGNAFFVVPYVTCWNNLYTYSAYSVMEEVFTVQYSNFPNYNFDLNAIWTPGPILGFPYSWDSFSSGAPGGYVGTQINSNNVALLNTPFQATFITNAGGGVGTLYITEGTGGEQTTGTVSYAGPSLSCGGIACDEVSFQGMPSGWCFDGCGTPPSSGFPFDSGIFYVTISAPLSAPTGVYTFEMEVSSLTGAGGPTFVTFHVVVAPDVGGCVAAGTLIATPGGAAPVQSLAPGDPVLEYNLSTGTLETGYVLFTTATNETSLINVNHGLIELTPTDQPIYVSNATYTGWLAAPDQLAVGDSLFAPQSGLWIPVTSVALVPTNATVYAVVTSNENNFIGSGVLLDLKALFAMRLSPGPVAPVSPGGVEFAQSAFDPQNGLLYLAEPGNGIVAVVDPVGPSVVVTIPVGRVPMGLAYDPTAQAIVVSDFFGGAVYEIQPSTNTIVAGPIPVGDGPTSITFDPLGQTLWVTNARSDTVSLLSAASLTLEGTLAAGTYPVASVFDAAQRTMWVASQWSGALLGYSAGPSAQPTATIALTGLPDSIAVAPRGGILLVGEIESAGVLLLNPWAAEGSEGSAASFLVPNHASGLTSTGVLFDPENGMVYVANGSGGDVLVVNPWSGWIVADVGVTGTPTGLVLDGQNGVVYAVDAGSGAVSAVALPGGGEWDASH